MNDNRYQDAGTGRRVWRSWSVLVFLLACAFITVSALASVIYLYFDLGTQTVSGGTQTAEEIIAEVSSIMRLPEDEVPTVATVSDPSKIKDQPFFANAKQGDKVLVYLISRRAILYDPAERKIIDVAPLSQGNPAPQATTTEPGL